MATACIVFVVIWCLDRKSPQGYYHVLKDSDEDGFTLLGKLASCTETRTLKEKMAARDPGDQRSAKEASRISSDQF